MNPLDGGMVNCKIRLQVKRDHLSLIVHQFVGDETGKQGPKTLTSGSEA
jgi:hypothetical protein